MSSLRNIARRLVPQPLWTKLRLMRIRRGIAKYPARDVTHTYGGVPLKVHLADPLGAGWYDHDWDELPELAFLSRSGRLGHAARVFDLGAHQGVVALMLGNIVGPQGGVIALEANEHNARVAERNRLLNNAQQITVLHA